MAADAQPLRLIVGISGASMPQLGIRLLQVLQPLEIETHLVISRGARRTIALEAPEWSVAAIAELADVVHAPEDLAAPIASGSFRTMGMAVVPCSMSLLGRIAYSTAEDLIGRAADVVLKESRTLVLMPRESPLHVGHLENMTRVARLGARLIPPVLGAYYAPKTIDDVVDHLIGRVLDQFGIENELVRRWGEASSTDAAAQAGTAYRAASVGIRPVRS